MEQSGTVKSLRPRFYRRQYQENLPDAGRQARFQGSCKDAARGKEFVFELR